MTSRSLVHDPEPHSEHNRLPPRRCSLPQYSPTDPNLGSYYTARDHHSRRAVEEESRLDVACHRGTVRRDHTPAQERARAAQWEKSRSQQSTFSPPARQPATILESETAEPATQRHQHNTDSPVLCANAGARSGTSDLAERQPRCETSRQRLLDEHSIGGSRREVPDTTSILERRPSVRRRVVVCVLEARRWPTRGREREGGGTTLLPNLVTASQDSRMETGKCSLLFRLGWAPQVLRGLLAGE